MFSGVYSQRHDLPKAGGTLVGDLDMDNANGPAMLNEAASLINPTLIPDKSAPASGIGGDGTLVAVVVNSITTAVFQTFASGVNYIRVTGQAAGSGPLIEAVGDDATIDLDLYAKGSGGVRLRGAGGGNTVFEVARISGTSRWVFYNGTPTVRATISGARNDPEAALASLLTELAAKGMIVDSTTAS